MPKSSRRAAEDLFVQAQEALAKASTLAAREVDEAKSRGMSEGEELLERARNEARQVARRTAEEEQVRREQLQLLEEHRGRVMEEIGVLHERLGQIGDGLSAPAPPKQSKQRARQAESARQAEPEAAGMPKHHEAHDEARHEARQDDTMILELPAGAKPARRKVASSAR